MAIRADRTSWELAPRYKNKRSGKPLAGFALDFTIRFNRDGAAFLQDHNMSGRNVMRFDGLPEVRDFVNAELERRYESHFGAT
jgi:hypothetical protein